MLRGKNSRGDNVAVQLRQKQLLDSHGEVRQEDCRGHCTDDIGRIVGICSPVKQADVEVRRDGLIARVPKARSIPSLVSSVSRRTVKIGPALQLEAKGTDMQLCRSSAESSATVHEGRRLRHIITRWWRTGAERSYDFASRPSRPSCQQ